MKYNTWVLGLLLFSFSISTSIADAKEAWFQTAQLAAYKRMVQNISAPGAAKGTVIASPSLVKPDYFYHWVRDAALIMEPVITSYARAKSERSKEEILKMLVDYIEFSRKLQKTPNPSGGLGEPKFNADGTAFTGNWGRPQNDSPALRAIGLIRLANILIKEGKTNYVKESLYHAGDSVIKADLEYVSKNWQHTCFDLWEEIRGHHFYTRMVMRKALYDGAKLADKLGDPHAALWYRKQVNLMEPQLERHWLSGKEILTATLDRDDGISYKTSGLDGAVILGVLHGRTDDDFFSYSNPKVLATARQIEIAFLNLYPVNKNGAPATAIGRYPEDLYDGLGWGEGNPWFITTNAFAELHHHLANEIEKKGSHFISDVSWPFFEPLKVQELKPNLLVEKNNPLFTTLVHALRNRGDEFLLRSKYHMDGSGSMSEQINRNSGFMQGARDLTWSYGSLFTALDAR